MPRLEDISLEALRGALEIQEGRRPVVRLLAAIIYKQGPSAPTIAEWLDVRPATVYAWFDRLEAADSIEEAIHDEPRPGRPPRLSAEERAELYSLLSDRPAAVGLDADEWTPRGVQRLVEERYGVRYSLRHVRRLLDETTS